MDVIIPPALLKMLYCDTAQLPLRPRSTRKWRKSS
jgi:hypothetical protein